MLLVISVLLGKKLQFLVHCYDYVPHLIQSFMIPSNKSLKTIINGVDA